MTKSSKNNLKKANSKIDSLDSIDYLEKFLPELKKLKAYPTELPYSYKRLRQRFFNEFKPQSLDEARYIEGVVEKTWLIRRLQQRKPEIEQRIMFDLIVSNLENFLISKKICDGHFQDDKSDLNLSIMFLVCNYLSGDQGSIKILNKIMEVIGISWEDLYRQTLEELQSHTIQKDIHELGLERQAIIGEYERIDEKKAKRLERQSKKPTTKPRSGLEIFLNPNARTAFANTKQR
jgi:hypothetical protein